MQDPKLPVQTYSDCLRSPTQQWHLTELNPRAMRGVQVRMDRKSYHETTFLDHRIVRPDDQKRHLLFDKKRLDRNRPKPAVDFVFHISFCGSTLLSRCLDVPGQRLALREPLVLRQIWEVGKLYPEEFNSARQRKLLRLVLPLLSKPSARGESVCIKPTNLMVDLAEEALAETRGKALCMVLPLESYLLSVAKKGLETIRRIVELGAFWGKAMGLPNPRTTFQSAAVFWAHHMNRMREVMQRAPGRTASLDFERFLATPEEYLDQAVSFLEQSRGSYDLAPLKINAKAPDQPFDALRRHQSQQMMMQTHGAAIRDAAAWLRANVAGDVLHWQLENHLGD